MLMEDARKQLELPGGPTGKVKIQHLRKAAQSDVMAEKVFGHLSQEWGTTLALPGGWGAPLPGPAGEREWLPSPGVGTCPPHRISNGFTPMLR